MDEQGVWNHATKLCFLSLSGMQIKSIRLELGIRLS